MLFRFFKGKRFIDVSVFRQNKFTQFIGLMFSSSKTPIRLFSYKSDKSIKIHSWFVFYSFLIVWLDKKNHVIAYKKVNPFTTSVEAPKKFRSFIEIPIDEKYAREVRFIVGKAKI